MGCLLPLSVLGWALIRRPAHLRSRRKLGSFQSQPTRGELERVAREESYLSIQSSSDLLFRFL